MVMVTKRRGRGMGRQRTTVKVVKMMGKVIAMSTVKSSLKL